MERPVNPDVIAACRTELDRLFRAGEDFLSYYEREIAPLPAPHAPV